jgi:hypothetical protein
MSLRKQNSEIQRLIKSFAEEAGKFHEISFSIYAITQSTNSNQLFSQPNHTIMLWQYYGQVDTDGDLDQLHKNLQESDMQWGMRGAQLSCFGVIEGKAMPLFLRMAKRAGSLFNGKEVEQLKIGMLDEITGRGKKASPTSKHIVAANDNPLAIWLNYLIYHLSKTNPGREKASRIEPDLFSLSLLALERLAVEPVITKADQQFTSIDQLKFKVALSFPGEKRPYVSKVARQLRKTLGKDAVFYDFDYQAQLARPNLDTLLQDIYRNRSQLVVVFLCSEYERKDWCGLEWRAIRDIIKSRDDRSVMFVRFDNSSITGVFSLDGYIDATKTSEGQLTKLINQRLQHYQPPSGK